MASQGPNSPGTAAATGWTNINNIKADDGSVASYSCPAASTSSVIATNFGFTIPLNSVITGVEIVMQRYGSEGDIKDFRVCLYNGGDLSVGTEYTTNWATSEEEVTFGGDGYLYGAEVTPAIVNSSTFGVQLYARNSNASSQRYMQVDYVSVKVYYVTASIPVFIGGAGWKSAAPKILIDGAWKDVSGVKILIAGAWSLCR